MGDFVFAQGHGHKVKASRVWQCLGRGCAGLARVVDPFFVFLSFAAADPDPDKTRSRHTPFLRHTPEIWYFPEGHGHKVKASRVCQSLGRGWPW